MKILYAIQGTGNGHLSRARHIIPLLMQRGVELDLLVSGIQADVSLPYPVRYRFEGLSFIFGKHGGVALWKTYLKANTARLLREIQSLPVTEYDLVINDFEPISAWACKGTKVPCVSFSHQAAVLKPNAPQSSTNDRLGKFILKNYAPANRGFGLHFSTYDAFTFTPIIRQEIRNVLNTPSKNHYTVYLPAYSDEKIVKALSQLKGVKWEVFSKHNKEERLFKNIAVKPIQNEAFIQSIASCKGILCGAGFETPAEALFLGKKLLVIPMKSQYEQQCNAAALKEMGVPVLKSLKKKHLPKIDKWLRNKQRILVNYPEITDKIIDLILTEAKVTHLLTKVS